MGFSGSTALDGRSEKPAPSIKDRLQPVTQNNNASFSNLSPHPSLSRLIIPSPLISWCRTSNATARTPTWLLYLLARGNSNNKRWCFHWSQLAFLDWHQYYNPPLAALHHSSRSRICVHSVSLLVLSNPGPRLALSHHLPPYVRTPQQPHRGPLSTDFNIVLGPHFLQKGSASTPEEIIMSMIPPAPEVENASLEGLPAAKTRSLSAT